MDEPKPKFLDGSYSRTKLLRISVDALVEFFSAGDRSRMVVGIPKGAVVRGADFDLRSNTFLVLLAHESFPMVPSTAQAPDLDLIVTECLCACDSGPRAARDEAQANAGQGVSGQ